MTAPGPERPRAAFTRRPARVLAGLLCLLCGAVTAAGGEAERLRAAEIAECRSGEMITWADGRDRAAPLRPPRFTYDPAGAPADMPEAVVLALLRRALEGWADCGVGGDLLPWQPGVELRKDVVTVLWSDTESRGNFGLADLGRRRLALSPGTFRLLRERNPAYDYRYTMQMAIAHEMGHFYGLMAHSRRCVDVTSYYHDGAGGRCVSRQPQAMGAFVEYRSALPTACDIARCRAANGLGAR